MENKLYYINTNHVKLNLIPVYLSYIFKNCFWHSLLHSRLPIIYNIILTNIFKNSTEIYNYRCLQK